MRFSRCWWLPKGPVRTNFQRRPRTQDISERECELYIDFSIDQVDPWAGGHEASTVVVLRFREVHRLCEIFALMFSFSILYWQKERTEKRVCVEYIDIVLESFVDVLLEALLQKERKKIKRAVSKISWKRKRCEVKEFMINVALISDDVQLNQMVTINQSVTKVDLVFFSMSPFSKVSISKIWNYIKLEEQDVRLEIRCWVNIVSHMGIFGAQKDIYGTEVKLTT